MHPHRLVAPRGIGGRRRLVATEAESLTLQDEENAHESPQPGALSEGASGHADPPARRTPKTLTAGLRHPEGKAVRPASVNGKDSRE